MVFKLLYLESYLGLSEETRSPTAGSEDERGQKPQPGFLLHRGAHLPKGRASGRSWASSPPVLPPGSRAGPWAAQRRWPGEGHALPGPARGAAPGPGVTLASSIPDHRDIGPGQPPHAYTPGGRKFFPRFFFPPWSSAGAGAPAAWRVQTLEAPAPPPPPREPSPAFRVLGPRSQARPGRAQPPGLQVPGAASVAP